MSRESSYVVRFYRKAEKPGEKDTFLGQVETDTIGTGPDLTLMAKAFRQASPKCLYADRVTVQRS